MSTNTILDAPLDLHHFHTATWNASPTSCCSSSASSSASDRSWSPACLHHALCHQLVTDDSTADTLSPEHRQQLADLILSQGLPSSLRGQLWQTLSHSNHLHLQTVYGQLCNERSPHERIIQRDLTRTFPLVDMFSQENGDGQLAMRRILIAYSLYDHQVGYCQGLAFLVGPLLMHMPEPEAFCVFVRLMETYNMRTMYTLTMDGLQLRLFQFNCLLERHVPRLAKHLERHHVHPAMYASSWFLTLFAYVFPLPLVTRIYDLLFLQGATETMMRIAIAMLQRSEADLLLLVECEDLLQGVATRKLCKPYGDNWSLVLQDAMALADDITTKHLDHLQDQYMGQPKQQPAWMGNRLGNFWRRRSLQQKKKPPSALPVSPPIRGCTSMEETPVPTLSLTATALSPPPVPPSMPLSRSASMHHRFDSHPKSSSPPLPPLPTTSPLDLSQPAPDVAALQCQVQDLHQQLNQALRQIQETKMDQQDLITEREALQITIRALEHRASTSPTSPPATSPRHSISPDIKDLQEQNNYLHTRNQHLEKQVRQLQQQLHTVNDDQLILIEKLASLTLDMDDLAQQKKQQDFDLADVLDENKRLTERLLCQDPPMPATRPLSPPLSTSSSRYPWEPAKEIPLLDDPYAFVAPPPPPHIPRFTPPSHSQPQTAARRSNSLYGRVWSALSKN
ncbi:RabGAP/TBC [Hesseltinella vesiculosa]|uniref:RabGAP/TBC n=1 Tax=Hesseltinella vesiculosa TaxID=101127 RepID=A0A1X2GQ33_9FUNG|nr:RabGAP/TBC [Hesseltinella vesiculosa]